jgi:hypothetical protein
LLLERHDQVSLTLQNSAAETPLHVARRSGAAFAIVRSLVHDFKASVQVATPHGYMPLFLASTDSSSVGYYLLHTLQHPGGLALKSK